MASIDKRANGTYRARYRPAPNSAQKTRTFIRKVDAQRWLDEVTAALVTGQLVDPHPGRQTVRGYAEQWRLSQVHRPTTAAHVETMLRLHVYPVLGDRPLASVLPSDVQSLVKRLSGILAPSTVGVVHRILAAVFKAAVRDRRIVVSPCEATKLPKNPKQRIEPLSVDAVQALAEAIPDRYRALVTLAAGTGLRQGEAFGLGVDRIDSLRRQLTVDRQLITLPGRPPYLAAPKTQASIRTIPLPQVVVDAHGAHLNTWPAEALVFTTDLRAPIRRTAFSARVWRPAVKAAGLPASVTFHALRHFYASLLIRHGESVKTVQARLGHASAAETLDTYSHLWPDSDDRTRAAVDSVLRTAEDSLRTAGPPRGQTPRSGAGDGRVGLYAGFCPRVPCGLPMGGHPSRPAVAGRLERSTRRHRAGSPRTPAQDGGGPPSLLTLLRVGFTEPHRSPGVRWSLTPPFHPYQCEHWRSVLCGTVPRVTPGRC